MGGGLVPVESFVGEGGGGDASGGSFEHGSAETGKGK
jgi:hypothetical protein